MQRQQEKKKRKTCIYVSALQNQLPRLKLYLQYIQLCWSRKPLLFTQLKEKLHLYWNIVNKQTQRKRLLSSTWVPDMSANLIYMPVAPWVIGRALTDSVQQNKKILPWSNTRGKIGQIKCSTCFRCFFSSHASGSGRGGRISALVGAITWQKNLNYTKTLSVYYNSIQFNSIGWRSISSRHHWKSENSTSGRIRTLCWYTDLAAVKVHKPDIIWHFEVRFVKKEASWYTYNVGSGGKKELCRRKHISQSSDISRLSCKNRT